MVESQSPSGDVPGTPTTVVLFDGVCVLCNRSVRWLADRDPNQTLRFFPLGSDAGRALLDRAGLGSSQPDSVVVLRSGTAWIRSDAAMALMRTLRMPWPLAAGCLRLVPRTIRDAAYRFVAARRYRWFGTHEVCPLPTPGERLRFPDDTDADGAFRLAGFTRSTASPKPRR